MTSETDSNYADIENIESILKIGNSGAPSIADLSPNSDWKSYPQPSYSCNYGLPYQDHNYGAPPPPTPPPSPGSRVTPVVRKKTFDLEALKSIKPNKLVPERKQKQPAKRQPRKAKVPTTPAKTLSPEPVKAALSPDSEEAEETEELNQGGDYSDSITRCICNFTHDDGYMICCDQCQVWQHIDCMGIDRANIPEEYSCEQCMPRKVSKARARMIQKNKLEELTRTSTSEDENANAKRPNSLNLKSTKAKNGGQNSKKLPNGKNGTVIQNGKKKGVTTPATGPALRSKRQTKGGSTDTVLLSVDGDTEESPWNAPYESATENQYSADIQQSLNAHQSTQTYKLPSFLTELDSPRCQLRLLTNGRRGLEVDTVIPSGKALIEFKGKVMLQQQFMQENDFTKRPQPFVLFYDQWDGLDICVDASSLGNEARFVQRSCVPNAEVRHVIENGQIHLVLFSVREIAAGSEVTIPYDFDFKACEYCVECACIKAQCPVRKAARKLKRTISQSGGGGTGDFSRHHTAAKQAATPQQTPTTTVSSSRATPVKRSTHEQLKVQIPENHLATASAQQALQANKPAVDELKSPTTEVSAEETRRLSREEKKIQAYMQAFEKMEKREERRKEHLQRISEKKESPTPDQVVDISDSLPQIVSPPVSQSAVPTTTAAPKSAPRPAARRRRNKSGAVTRRRTSSSTVSQPVSEAEQDDNSNSAATTPGTTPGTATSSAQLTPSSQRLMMSRSCDVSLDTEPATSTRVPTPAEVGSTYSGTVSAPQSSSSSNLGFRFPKTKKHLLNEWYHEKGLDRSNVEKPLSVTTSMNDNIDFVKMNSSPGSSWAHLRRNSMTSNGPPTSSSNTPTVPTRKLDTSMGSAKKRWLKQAMEEVEDSNHQQQQSVSTLSSPLNNGQSSPPQPTPQPPHTQSAQNSNTTGSSESMGGEQHKQTDTVISPISGHQQAAAVCHTTSATGTSHIDFVTPLKKRRMARESVSLDSHPTSPEQTHSAPQITPTQTALSFIPPPEETANHAPMDALHSSGSRCLSPSKQSNTTTDRMSVDENVTKEDNEPCHARPGHTQGHALTAESDDKKHVPVTVSEQDDLVPETVRRYSPVMRSNVSSDVPTTVFDVDNSDGASTRRPNLCISISPNKMTSSAQSDRQSATESDGQEGSGALMSPGGTAVIMSPRQPRTLSDLMKKSISQHEKQEKYCQEVVRNLNNELGCSPDRHTITAQTANLLHPAAAVSSAAVSSAVTESLDDKDIISPVKVGPRTPEPQSPSSGETSPATPLRLHQIVPTSARREDLMHSPSRLLSHSMSSESSYHLNKAPQDGGLSMSPSTSSNTCKYQVLNSPINKQDERYGDVPNTPPQKKKVSLLEYRKRMKVQPSSGKHEDDTEHATGSLTGTSLSSSLTSDNYLKQSQSSLPSLPLFTVKEEVRITNTRLPISLDERLNKDFGITTQAEAGTNGMVVDNKGSDSVRCRTPPPPPPPPVLPTHMSEMPRALLDPLHHKLSLPPRLPVLLPEDITRPLENGCTDSAQERTGILSAANHSHQSIVKPSSNGSASPPITTQNTAAKKTPVSLKQGSLGAVMLGQPVSPVPTSGTREYYGSRAISPTNLPKKYR